MKANINDVAKRAGVSTATVSRTFSSPDRVAPATRDKVLKAAEHLNFNVSRSAGVLKSGKSYRIALLMGQGPIEWFTAGVIKGLDDVFRPAGYDLALYPIDTAETRTRFFEELPIRSNVDAVMVSSFSITPQESARLASTGIPIVGINTMADGFTATVGIDDKIGIRLIVRHLAALGHRNFMYIYETFDDNAPEQSLGYSSHNRIIGFAEACKEIPGITSRTIKIESGIDMIDTVITNILALDAPPTALCFHQDSQAIPFLFHLYQCGIDVPQSLSVTGFDDIDLAQVVGLTTVHQNPCAMASLAAQKALTLINGNKLETPYETAPIQLVIRDTTARPRKTPLLQ